MRLVSILACPSAQIVFSSEIYYNNNNNNVSSLLKNPKMQTLSPFTHPHVSCHSKPVGLWLVFKTQTIFFTKTWEVSLTVPSVSVTCASHARINLAGSCAFSYLLPRLGSNHSYLFCCYLDLEGQKPVEFPWNSCHMLSIERLNIRGYLIKMHAYLMS